MTGFGEPDRAMWAAVARLADFMAGTTEATEGIFWSGPVTILDNHPPYVFDGTDAVPRWLARFRARHPDFQGLAYEFGPVMDFERTEPEVYFSLPTTWTWRRGGKGFHETGGWSFVLRSDGAEWRIRSHGWAVTSYTVLD